MSAFLSVLFALIALLLVWRFLASLFQPERAEQVEAPPVDGPFSTVPALRKNSPKGRSGAVALEEPDDDFPADCYPPRTR